MESCKLLPVTFEFNGETQTIFPALLQDEKECILVDCGYPNFIPLLEEAAERIGVNLQSLTKIIITHHDMDHIGCLAALKRKYPHVELIAPEMEAPYVEGRKKSLRLEQAEASLQHMPDDARSGAEQFIRFLQSIEPAKVDRTISNGERLPWCNGMEIVHTPGHMPGHISLYLPSSKTLIAGDVVVIENGELNIANPQFALDLDEAVRSCERLLDYDIERLVCYHGGEFQGNIKQAMQMLIRRYS